MMKKGIFAILALFLVILLSFSAFASDFSYTFEDDDDGYFERSNPADSEDDDELDDPSDAAYGTVVITPVNSTYTIDNVTMSLSDLDYYDADPSEYEIKQKHGEVYEEDDSETYLAYEIVDSKTNASQATVRFIISAELDAIDDNNGDEVYKFYVNIEYNNTVSIVSEKVLVEFKVTNELVLKKDTVDFESATTTADCDLEDNDCDEDIDEFVPGEDIEMSFTLENKLNDIDMLDVEVEIDLNGDVDEDTLDESVGTIDKDSEEVVSVKIEPDSDAEDELQIEILVYGEDEFGAVHGFYYDFDDLEFNIPDVNMQLDVDSLPSSVCAGDDVEVAFEVTNYGADDQDNLIVRVQESGLSWLRDTPRFDLKGEDDGDYESEDFSFMFTVPSNARVKSYSPRVTLYFEDEDGDDDTVFETLSLNIVDCDATSSDDDSDDDSTTDGGNDSTDSNAGIVITQPDSTDSTNDAADNGAAVVTAKPKDSGNLEAVGIVLLVLLLIAAVVSLVVVLLKK